MRVYVSGYWAKNLGDDLFLKILCNRYKNIQFEIDVSKEFSTPFQQIENLHINYLPSSKWKIMRALKKLSILISRILRKKHIGFFMNIGPYMFVTSLPDAYVEIGGSIFMLKEGESLNKNSRFKQRMKLADVMDNYFVIGSNFGPYSSIEQIEEYSAFFNKISDTCFRDEKSKSLFPKIDNARYEADVILSYSNKIRTPTTKRHILISLIDIIYKKDVGTEALAFNVEDYENKITEIVIEYAKKGEKVILFSFCDFQGDNNISERIYEKIHPDFKKNVQTKSHRNIEESLSIISSSKKIIATRFHAMIIGWLFRIPTYVISYSKKTEDVISWSVPYQNFIRYSDIKQLTFEKLEHSYSTISEERLERLKVSSNKQFYAFDKFIKAGGERSEI